MRTWLRLPLIILSLGIAAWADEPDPADFAVPEAAFQDLSIKRAGDDLGIESESFSAWLKKTGRFGELVALHDTRLYDLAMKAASSRLKGEETSKQQFDATGADPRETESPLDRVCDVAYHLMCKRYNLKPLSYRDNYRKRDAAIRMLKDRIANTRSGRP